MLIFYVRCCPSWRAWKGMPHNCSRQKERRFSIVVKGGWIFFDICLHLPPHQNLLQTFFTIVVLRCYGVGKEKNGENFNKRGRRIVHRKRYEAEVNCTKDAYSSALFHNHTYNFMHYIWFIYNYKLLLIIFIHCIFLNVLLQYFVTMCLTRATDYRTKIPVLDIGNLPSSCWSAEPKRLPK